MDTLLETILPKLLTMTLASVVVASGVGTWVALVGRLGSQRKQQANSERPARSLVTLASLGAFIGSLLGLLLYEANPTSLNSGPFTGLTRILGYIVLLPLFSVAGTVIGVVASTKLPTHLRQSKLVGIALATTYALVTGVLYITLSIPPVTISRPETTTPFPAIAQISGYDDPPKDLALSANGQLLAVARFVRDRDSIDIWDLSAQKLIHRLGNHSGSLNFQNIVSSLSLGEDGKELMTAAAQQVQVNNLANNQVRLRLEGGYIALPMAGNKLVTLALVDSRRMKPPFEPYTLKVWDLQSGKLLQTLPANLKPTEQNGLPLAISLDRRLLAFPSLNKTLVDIWDMTTGKQVAALGDPQKDAWPRALAFSPDGQQIAVANVQSNPMTIWDWQQEKQVKQLPELAHSDWLGWTAQGILAQYRHKGQIDLVDPQTGKVTKTVLAPNSTLTMPAEWYHSTKLSADAKTLAFYTPESIKIWRVD